MLPKEVQEYINEQKGTSIEKLRNIKYMFMRDLHQQYSEINKMTIPEVMAFLQRLEEDAKSQKGQDKKGAPKRMG